MGLRLPSIAEIDDLPSMEIFRTNPLQSLEVTHLEAFRGIREMVGKAQEVEGRAFWNSRLVPR